MKRSNSCMVGVVCIVAAACGGCSSSSDKQQSSTGNEVIAELASCDESDMVADLPWSGSAIDPQTGKLKEPLPDGFVIASTVGWPTEEGKLEIQKNTISAIGVAFTYPTLLAAQFGTSQRCGAGRSLQIWRDEAAMVEYVLSDNHQSVAPLARTHTKGWETTHWSGNSAEELPTWADSRARLDAARRK
jgi:hypothetical protein